MKLKSYVDLKKIYTFLATKLTKLNKNVSSKKYPAKMKESTFETSLSEFKPFLIFKQKNIRSIILFRLA